MSHYRSAPAPVHADSTTCSSLLRELKTLWDEIGENDFERDQMIFQIEQECLDVYRRKVDLTRKYKADLYKTLTDAEATASNIVSALGEQTPFSLLETTNSTLKEKVAAINPKLEGLQQKKEERLIEFRDTEMQIFHIRVEIAGRNHCDSTSFQVNEQDLSLKKLGDLKCQLQELQMEKSNRLKKISSYIQMINDLSDVLSLDNSKIMSEIHPTLEIYRSNQEKSISNDTISKLAETTHSLIQEKKERLKKLQDLGSTLIELWNLMDTTADEQRRFDHVTSLISASADGILCHGCLAADVIENTKIEVNKLNVLKASKAKELILKKQNELEQICRDVHIYVDSDAAQQRLFNLIETGSDLCELLSNMDNQIAIAKDQALSRKDILDKVEKWKFASEEECWLDDYERDQNRYIAGRGAHKNLKRAEKARALVSKLPSMVETLILKVKAWEKDKEMTFSFEKMRLLDLLEEHNISRQQKEEDKRRSREQKKIQDQLTAEQELLFGSKPSPMRQLSARKPLGQSASVNMPAGTPLRRISTSSMRPRNLMLSKERKDKMATVIPLNYVALPKDDLVS